MIAYALVTFGDLRLVHAGTGTPVGASRRKPLAVLALLAAHAPGGLPRERVATLLWPEADTERARQGLNQTLYALRRELGANPVRGTATLVLDGAVVASDLAEFWRATAEGDAERAAAIVARGPFLDAVAFPGCAEFERWVEQRRAEYAAALTRLLADWARAAVGAPAAVQVMRWGQVVAAAPLDATLVREAAHALRAAGCRTDAASLIRLHIQTLRRELEAEPDDEILALLENINRGTPKSIPADGPLATRSGEAHGPTAGVAIADRGERDRERVPARVDPSLAAREPPTRAPAWAGLASLGARRRVVALAIGVGAVLGAGAITHAAGSNGDARRAQRQHVGAGGTAGGERSPDRSWTTLRDTAPSTLAVFPLGTLGATAKLDPATAAAAADVGEAVAVLLTAALDGGARLHVVDGRLAAHPTRGTRDLAAAPALTPAAAARAAGALGAPFFIAGDVVATPAAMPNAAPTRALTITARVYATADPTVAVATAAATGPAGALPTLVDSLARGLLATRGREWPGQLVPTAARTTRSPAALQAFLDGERALRSGQYGAALTAYAEAVRRDTLFALAYYRLGAAADWAGENALTPAAAARARALAARLPLRERLLVTANSAWERGEIRDAERMLESEAALYPDDPEGLYLLGEVLFHTGPLVGRAPADAGPLFARVAALEPENVEALAHLARLEAHAVRPAAVAALARRVAALRPEGDRLAAELALLARMTAGDRTPLNPGVRIAPRPGDEPELLRLAAWRLAAYTDSLAYARRLAQRLVIESPDRYRAFVARREQAEYAANGGVLDAALAPLGEPGAPPAWGLVTRAYFAALPLGWADRRTLAAYADSLDRFASSNARDVARVLQPAGIPLAPAAGDGATLALAAYPRALLAVALGDTATARRWIATLEATARMPSRDEGDYVPALAHRLAWAVRAELACAAAGQEGRRTSTTSLIDERRTGPPLAAALDRALQAFDSATTGVPIAARMTLFGGLARERYRRAQLLAAVGRYDEAVRWYTTLDGGDSAGDTGLRAAAARGRAEALAVLGRGAIALQERARAARLTRDGAS